MTDYVYDIETYPSTFTCYIGNTETKGCTSIEISDRKDERGKLFSYLNHIRRTNGRMVGFNNIGFDYPVLHFLLENKKATVLQIYDKAMAIINCENRFEHNVWEGKHYVQQLDLYKIHHFDNVARATSLKILEFNMRSENIEDLPFPVGKMLTSDEVDTLLIYNKHDMVQTNKFYNRTESAIQFREKLTKEYGKNFINYNDTKIGKEYFIMRLEEDMPGSCFKGRVVQQTKRESIKLAECILEYISFESPEFNAILKWLKDQEIKETKGVFTDILENDIGGLAKYATMRTKRQKLFTNPSDKVKSKWKSEKPYCFFTREELKSGKVSYWVNWNVLDNLNVNHNGFKYDFGTGGIHGSLSEKIVRSDGEYVVHDEDVASYYPNLAIKNRLYPEHLSEVFCDIYEDVYNQRKEYAKGTSENAMLKLALNGVYGESNSKFSPFYDPKYTMSITINGQLLLCMLAEKLSKIDSLTMIQINTDGLTYRIKRGEDYERSKRICKNWEKLTKLDLEGVDYDAMYIRDVNNYISLYPDGSLKNKGAYQWDGLGYHQNHSSLIIPMAVEQHLVHGKDVSEFIRSHEDIYDFMMRTKVPRSSSLVLSKDDVDEPLQNICRYYASLSGGTLVKIMPPIKEYKTARVYEGEIGERFYGYNKGEITRFDKKYTYLHDEEILQPYRRIGINTNQKVIPCNDINDFRGEIDYDYYINEAIKLCRLEEL